MISAQNDVVVQTRINARTKEKALRVLKRRGVSMSGFLRAALAAVAETGTLPVEPMPPKCGKLFSAGKTRAEIEKALWD